MHCHWSPKPQRKHNKILIYIKYTTSIVMSFRSIQKALGFGFACRYQQHCSVDRTSTYAAAALFQNAAYISTCIHSGGSAISPGT